MRKHNRFAVRLVALILAGLLALGAIVSIILSEHAHAEGNSAPDRYEISAEFLEDEQALRVSQRLVYVNRTGEMLDRVEFSVYGNMFRRASALMYESGTIAAAFPEGYAPGGIELSGIAVNGRAADWGMIGENELFLRVACQLEDGESCEFGFEYTLLLTKNAAFLGVGDTDWRLSGFYPEALKWEDGDFVAPRPLQHARYVFADRADYAFSITLPDRYTLAAPGEAVATPNGDGTTTWSVAAPGVRELAVSFGMRWRELAGETALGTRVRVLSNLRSGAPKALKAALGALNTYEKWFGALGGTVTVAQSDHAAGLLALPGVLWLPAELFSDEMALRRGLAKQFFGYGAYFMPTEDAWMSDALSEYLAYLALEDKEGHGAFLKELNRALVPSVQYTVPGGLEVTSDASLFTEAEYDTIVRRRGALVFHELRSAMGLEAMLEGLHIFYEKGLASDVLGEYDLVDALDRASGGSWEAFLTDWLFNIDQYQRQNIEWME